MRIFAGGILTILITGYAVAVALAPTAAVAQSPLPPCNSHIANGFFTDCGNQTFSNGDRYVGETLFGKPNGLGTYTWVDGEKYVGELRDGKRDGRGVQTYSDGREYVGEWRDDKRNGQGTTKWSNVN